MNFARSRSDLKLSLLQSVPPPPAAYRVQPLPQPRAAVSQQARDRFSASIGVRDAPRQLQNARPKYLAQKLIPRQDRPFLDVSASFKALQSQRSAFVSQTVRAEPVHFTPGPGDYEVGRRPGSGTSFSRSRRFETAEDFAQRQTQLEKLRVKVDRPLGPRSYDVPPPRLTPGPEAGDGDRFREDFAQKYRMEMGPGWHDVGRREEMRGGTFSETGNVW
uniref:Uncharacterized protein n=1 Tax=Spironucleus salmonicida TaxID=348837 RepID=V6LSZ9_9EUKA|eukprot:EST47383.1 Hypothetical protein SS50377_12370 [Spironucleus salmonicida]